MFLEGVNAMFDDLGIIVVLYHPKLKKIKKNFSTYCVKGLNIVFVVNSASENIKNQLSKGFINYPNVHVIYLTKNAGIAKAQNIAIEFYFKRSKIKKLLFLDQDSYMEIEELDKLQKLLYNSNLEDVALVGPGLYKYSQGGLCEVTETISSGSLIPVDILRMVGLFREDYFIDFVDYEWCWRAKSYGFNIYVDGKIKINHQTEDDVHRRMGHTMESTFRLYYVYRNLLWSLKDTHMSSCFKTKWLFRYFVKALFQITIASNRSKRFKSIAHGVFDGLTGRKNTG